MTVSHGFDDEEEPQPAASKASGTQAANVANSPRIPEKGYTPLSVGDHRLGEEGDHLDGDRRRRGRRAGRAHVHVADAPVRLL